MLKYLVLVVCCVILWCVQTSTARGIPKYNFSISSLYNQTGVWYAEKIQLDHEGDHLWNVIVNYTNDDSKNSQSILIVDNKLPPTSKMNISLDDKQCQPVPGCYELLAGFGYYKVYSQGKPWHEALRTCEQEGSHLYIFNSKKEAEAVGALIVRSHSGTQHWIGIHDQYKEGHYVTIFNETFEQDLFWRVDNLEEQDCGYSCSRNSFYCLDDAECHTNNPFICEKEM